MSSRRPIPRTQPLKRSQKPIAKRRKVKKSSLRWQNVNDEYKLFPSGRMVHFETTKGRIWYWKQTLAMAERQGWKCGFIPSGNCVMPSQRMYDFEPGNNLNATFQHGGLRGLGGATTNDDINDPENFAGHHTCNGRCGSRRIPVAGEAK